MMRHRSKWLPLGAVLMLLTAGGAPRLEAQPAAGRPLSLEDALRRAEERSDAVVIARAAVQRARGGELRVRSELWPQLSAFASFDRTLASEFEGAFGGGAQRPEGRQLPPCTPLVVDPSLPVERRLARVESALACDDGGGIGGIDFSDLPFGRENIYRFGLALSQNLYSGGRIRAQERIAQASRSVAEIELAAARAQVALEVARAYYDAALSERLLGIAQSTLAQSERTLAQTQLAREVGNQPEFALLRAQVSAANQRPVVIQRRAERDLALLRLRQLLELPPEEELELTVDLDDPELRPLARFAARVAEVEAAAGAPARAPVRQAAQLVQMRRAGVDIARAQRLPQLTLSSNYSRVAYPDDPLLTSLNDLRTNWTAGLTLSVPILTGGRIRGDVLTARADLDEAEARLEQARDLADLDTRSAHQQLTAAQAAWEASSGTVQQASRAYEIAELRYREGISTQLELADARILLEQAQANRARAARDLQLARIRLALLPDLPLGNGPAPASTAAPAEPNSPRPMGAPAAGVPLTGSR